MSSSDRVQSVRNAWMNAARAELLRDDAPAELPRVVIVGVWIATYADADGGNAWPGRDTLAKLTGFARETVTRAVKVLTAVGMLRRKRRPNASSMYQLVMPAGRVDWSAYIDLFTDTRQRRAHARKRAEDVAAEALQPDTAEDRTASTDALPTDPPEGADSVPGHLPDSVHGGVPNDPGQRPRTPPEGVHGRPAEGVHGRPDHYPSTSGRDPQTDHNPVELSPQPQQRASSGPEDESPNPEPRLRRCAACGDRMLPRPGRDRHAHCEPDADRHPPNRRPVQGAIPIVVTGGAEQPTAPPAPSRAEQPGRTTA